MKKDETTKVESLNAPKLEIEGIEEFEKRAELGWGKVGNGYTSNMCSSWLYGGC